MTRCLILGTGYCGKYYLKRFPDCLWTSRRESPSDIESSNKPIRFDLMNKKTWDSLAQIDCQNILWTFPAASNAEELANSLEVFNLYFKNKNVLVYSSTSAYVCKIENELVDETFPLRLAEFRFQAEEDLRENGAMIVHLSGIIGPDRYPKSWYERNLVKYGQNILNYIHVDDIVTITNELFKRFKAKERFNLTSADYKKHVDIAASLNCATQFSNNVETNASKLVDNKKLVEYLNLERFKFKKYPEFF